MNYEAARAMLHRIGQEQVLRFWDRLTPQEQDALLAQIEALDENGIGRMRALLAEETVESSGTPESLRPAEVLQCADIDRQQAYEAGCEALRAGTVGAVLVAGGQGSRLGYDGPKGCYSIGPVSGASLFEIHARKILALQQAFGRPVPFYIMTSQANDAPTRKFFRDHGFFGLAEADVKFFAQGMWPALTGDGRLVLDTPGHLFMSPDGHGGILRALERTGMLKDMTERGLDTLFYFQVDNPLVEIADPVFIGLHRLQEAQISVKVCAKRDPQEGLGVVVQRGDSHAIVEYTELTDEQKQARLGNGDLRFRFGSVAIHVFSLDFLKQEAAGDLPLHVAHKKVPYCDEDGNVLQPEAPNAYKFEKFIFDVLPDATRVLHVEFLREEEFAPVKNAAGSDSPATAQQGMMEKFARWLITAGVDVPRDASGNLRYRIEIDPLYARDAVTLKEKLPPGFVLQEDCLLGSPA